MMNEMIYKRLSNLYKKLGISHQEGSAERGELLAYSMAIDDLCGEYDSCFRQIFADTATGYGLSLFCEMFGIDSSLGDDEKRNLIAEGMSRIFGLSSLTDIGKAVEELGNDFSVSCKDFNMVISGTVDHSADVLTKLGKIIENYLPPCTVVKFCSDGLDFDNWDSSPYLFKNYDNFNLSFDILDTLRRTNEQYK